MGTGRPTGHPTKLTHRISAPTDENPLRTVTVGEYICEMIATTGRRPGACAAAAGVSRRACDQWLVDAKSAEVRQQEGKLLYPQERLVLDFLLKVRLAQSRWVAERIETHKQIASGGLTTVEVIEKTDPTETVTNDDGERVPKVLERRVKTTRLLPDARAIEWELKMLAGDEFAERLELTGADGGPIRTEDARVEAAELAELSRLADTYLEGVEDGQAREAELRDTDAEVS